MKKIKFIAVLFSLLILCSCGKKSDIELSTTFDKVVISSASEITSDSSEISETANESITDENTTKAEKNHYTTLQNYVSNESTADTIPAENDVSEEASSQKPDTFLATFSVDCKTAVSYGIRNNSSFTDVIPENGIILDNTTIEFSDGDSVMKALKNVLKKNSIAYQITSGGYVRSIGGLSEFDCGSGSGWLYNVNGVYPDVSCKSYTLKSGDKVELIYTCG